MAKQDITITTEDGIAQAVLTTPASLKPPAAQPGVILYMDAFGLRPAMDAMAARLAQSGYLVLAPDLFYRLAPYGPFDAKTSFSQPELRDALMHLIQSTTQDMTRRDSAAFLDTLTQAGAQGRIGTIGYCMGGGRALTAAAAYPARIVAAASIHGGGLASDAADSPHRHVRSIKARLYVACAGVDNSFPPEQSAKLAQALREAEIDHIIENYIGMQHGWAVPDHGVYDQVGAERHWKRLLTLFQETL